MTGFSPWFSVFIRGEMPWPCLGGGGGPPRMPFFVGFVFFVVMELV